MIKAAKDLNGLNISEKLGVLSKYLLREDNHNAVIFFL